MNIDYDEAKRQRTLEERGLDFRRVPEVFGGIKFTRIDGRKDYGETRLITVGPAG